MGRLRLQNALPPILLIFLCVVLSCYAHDTPSTFKKMLMAAGAEKAFRQARVERGIHEAVRRDAPRTSFRTQLRRVGADDNSHVVSKRSHNSNHVDDTNLSLEEPDETLRKMEKRFYLSPSYRFPNNRRQPVKKPSKYKNRKPSSSSSLKSMLGGLMENSQVSKEEKEEKDEVYPKTKEEEKESAGTQTLSMLKNLLSGFSSPDKPDIEDFLDFFMQEEMKRSDNDFDGYHDRYEAPVKRFDPYVLLSKGYQEKHADNLVAHLLEKREKEIQLENEEEEEAEEEAEAFAPEIVEHESPFQRSGLQAKRSEGGMVGLRSRYGAHQNSHFSAPVRRSGYPLHDISSSGLIPRVPLTVKHRRATYGKRAAPMRKSPMFLGVKRSLSHFAASN